MCWVVFWRGSCELPDHPDAWCDGKISTANVDQWKRFTRIIRMKEISFNDAEMVPDIVIG